MPTCGTPSTAPTLITCTDIDPASPASSCTSPIRTVTEIRADPPDADGTIVFWATPVVWSYSGTCVIATPGKTYIHAVITCCSSSPTQYDSSSNYLGGGSCYACTPDDEAYLQYKIDLTGLTYTGPCSPDCTAEIAKIWTLTWDTDKKWKSPQFTFDEQTAQFVLEVTEEPGTNGVPAQKIKLTLETPDGSLIQYDETYWNYVTTLPIGQTAISEDVGGKPFWPSVIDITPVPGPTDNPLTSTEDAYLQYYFDLTNTPVSAVVPELAIDYTLVTKPDSPYTYRSERFEKDGITYWWAYSLGTNNPDGPISLQLMTNTGPQVTYTGTGGVPLSAQTLTRQTVSDDLGGDANWPTTITVFPSKRVTGGGGGDPPAPALCGDLSTSEQVVLTIDSPCDCEDTGAGSPMSWGGSTWDTSGHADCGGANEYHLGCSGDVWTLTSDTAVCHASAARELVYSSNSPFTLIFRETFNYVANPPSCDACASATGYIYYTITK